jgi:mercuric ion transport protein
MTNPVHPNRSLLAGAVAAVTASVCCVGPLVLLMLGVSGAWIGYLTAFEPYRPILIGVTLVFLGLAFRRLYLAPQVCAPGKACAAPAHLTKQRMLFWSVSTLLIALLAFPSFAPIFID